MILNYQTVDRQLQWICKTATEYHILVNGAETMVKSYDEFLAFVKRTIGKGLWQFRFNAVREDGEFWLMAYLDDVAKLDLTK